MELKLAEIIEKTGARLVSKGSAEVFSGVASLDEASAEDVSFLGNEKYYQDYLDTKAGLVFVPQIVEQYPEGVAILEIENPSFAFGQIVKMVNQLTRTFAPGVHPAAWVADDVQFNPEKVSIKAGAIVESGAILGDGVELNAGVSVGVGVKIGAHSTVHANVTIREYCELGERVILQPGCVIGSDGYGYEFVDGKHEKVDQVGIVVLEDDVEIGANTTIDRARFGKTVVGEGSKVDNLVQIAHNVKIGKHSLVVAQTGIAGSAEIGNYVTIAAQSGVAGHIKIGDKAILLGRTGATKSLDGDAMYMGMPPRLAKDERKSMVMVARLPQIYQDLKVIKKKLDL
ncbi:UDP-3-O-(3-hydroxymyristoyl)glucosamine N-acyltransferase [Rubritalea marina]|uniref:UDP-3-O-(3-hydroxymyristoyl)glucosamine N-acyltransferase n=1 Tax=Rubritalea marina TaxID=361055 RepID=UPI00146160CD|nr:UDP-3-O-(3-hydroxymyristoyl)glucosamine N-acyltransferase [Rubritalea marina]